VGGRDVVVIGASAGGLVALKQLASSLPSDLPAALLVVVHGPPDTPGLLPDILTGAGVLPARYAVDDEAFQPGRIEQVIRGDRKTHEAVVTDTSGAFGPGPARMTARRIEMETRRPAPSRNRSAARST
jgi:chemotaxis response regulator CheB